MWIGRLLLKSIYSTIREDIIKVKNIGTVFEK